MENDFEEEETELSMDWIHDFEKMYSENTQYPLEKMQKMNVYYLYVENGWITRMVPRKVVFDLSVMNLELYFKELGREGLSGFVKERLLETTELISSEELVSREFLKMSEKNFVLSEIMLFNVDIEPEKISEFSDCVSIDPGNICNLFRTFSCFVGGGGGSDGSGGGENWGDFSQIEWKDSVFIFHCVNAIYFVYHLSTPDGVDVDSGMKVNPILVWDNPGRSFGRNNKTKRVHFPLEMGSDESEHESDSGDDASDDSGELDIGVQNWGKGKWLRKRRRNRTRKVTHVLNSSLIHQLFSS